MVRADRVECPPSARSLTVLMLGLWRGAGRLPRIASADSSSAWEVLRAIQRELSPGCLGSWQTPLLGLEKADVTRIPSRLLRQLQPALLLGAQRLPSLLRRGAHVS